jgi:urease accessory protein
MTRPSGPPAARAALLLLADGRFPAGGHAHSGGAEAAVADGRIRDAATLADFCRGRLHTTGLVAAALAAAATAGLDPLALDGLGRQLLRAARAAWPDPALDRLAADRPRGAHQPIVLGITARAAGLGPLDAAHAALYESASGPATAAVRLLSLDPVHAAAVLARLAPEIDAVAEAAARAAERAAAEGSAAALPAASAPLLDIAAEHHAAWPVRLFAS